MRIGQGFDVHAFAEGRPLILGGIEIPHDRGLLGHSDADVLLHTIADAALGAADRAEPGMMNRTDAIPGQYWLEIFHEAPEN